MELPMNIIRHFTPMLCESEHERMVATPHLDKQQSNIKPIVTIVRVAAMHEEAGECSANGSYEMGSLKADKLVPLATHNRNNLPSSSSLSTVCSSLPDAASTTPFAPTNIDYPSPSSTPMFNPTEHHAKPASQNSTASVSLKQKDLLREMMKIQVLSVYREAWEKERAACEEELFGLQLDKWAAETRYRREVEREEDHRHDGDGSVVCCTMGRCRSFVWEQRQRCWRGLSVVVGM